MKTYDIVIIGGGASGLMCANNLAHIFSVAVIDGVALGKKLLVTGNGRCNFTNINLDSAFYNTKQVQKYIKEFDEKDTIKFFKEMGIESFADDEGRVYPLSESAKDVQKALTQKLSCDYISGKVIRLTKKGLFEITLESGEVVKSKKVVMACGNRNIEEILSDFKLPFEKKEPVLCGFKVKGFDKSLFGLREDVILKSKNFKEKGQVQFRKDGISGIVVFNLSAKVKDEKPFDVEIELLPEISESKIEGILVYRRENCGDFALSDCLLGILKGELAKYILKECKILTEKRTLSGLSDIEIKSIAYKIKHLKMTCTEKYDDCQVLSGGISLKNLSDFQSEIKGLYFCGESTNVFGACGGYNLQWAWSSGYCLAKELNRNL